MGVIISRFRRKKTTLDILETLENDIKEIEDYGRNTEQAHKKTVGRFMLFSVLIYLLTAFLFYFYFFPANIYDQLFYIIPLIFAPVIIISVKKVLTWYYNRKLSRNQLKLKTLKDEKKKMLDKVMDTETYKSAKIILEKFAPEQIRKSTSTTLELTPSRSSIEAPSISVSSAGLRQRMLPGPNSYLSTRASIGGTPGPYRSPYFSSSSVALQSAVTPGTALINNPGTPLPLPRAILPRERSVLDKMVDYLVGDGPANRYALICRQCFSHNGMAVREEFEYISFRCCYCYHFNPARKKRPIAPKLDFEPGKSPMISKFSSSDTDKSSYSDTDSETDKIRNILGSSDPSKISDTEKLSDFDKLSDAETKNFESGLSPREAETLEKKEEAESGDKVEEGKEEVEAQEVNDL